MSDAGGDLAGYGARVGATLLDNVLIVAVAFVLAVVATAAGVPTDASGYVVIGVVGLSILFYAPVLMCRSGSRNGQTLGKQALAIRVVRQDAQPMTASPALLRDLVGKGLLGLIPFYTIVDYVVPLGDSRRQAIHDKLAGTFVVRADAVPDFGPSTPGASGAWDPPVVSGWTPPATPTPPPAPAQPRPAPVPAPAGEPSPDEGSTPPVASEAPAPTEAPAGTEPPDLPYDDEEEIRGPFGPSSSETR